MQKFIESLDLGAKGLWFPVTASLVLVITVLFIPKKHINWREIYITFGMVAFTTWLSDGILARGFDLFDIGDPKKPGLGDILSYTFIPTSLSILFLNYLTKNNLWKLTILFTLLALLIEYGMVSCGYLKLKGWNWLSSLIVFLIAFRILLPLHIRFIRKE